MSQAEELLNSLSTDEVAAYAARSTVEPHIIIGADRFITVPTSLRRIAVEHDHNVETVTFECPRYWDEHDLSKMAIYINYILSNGYADSYPVSNITVEGDLMLFTWTISRNVTQVNGGIKFLVCVKKTDSDGNEVNHWNSELCEDMYVSEGMENVPQIAAEYPDLITELLLRMKTVEEINVQADAMQTLLDETQAVAATAEQVKNEALDASDYIKNSYANAIKGNVSGEIIRVDDVSPIEHNVKCWVHGKNLFNINDYVTETDYSNNQTIYAINADHLVVGKTYTIFSSVPMQWFKISNSATGYSCVGRENSIDGMMSYTFVHTRNPNILETSSLHIYINNLDRTAMYDLSIMDSMNICLVEGSIVTDYEPYLDPTAVKLIQCKRNIFNVGTVSDYQRIGDMTIQGQSIRCGVTSSNSSHVVNTTNKYPSGVYSLKFDYSDSTPRILLRLYNKNGDVIADNTVLKQSGYQYNDAYKGFFKNGKEDILTISDDVAYWCLGFVFPVTDTAPVGSVTNVYNVRLECGDGINQHELYDGESINPDSDGVCIITSKSPIMTIFTDTPDVSIDIEYNRDTTKMFESYVLSEEAKNEIAGLVGDDFVRNTDKTNSIGDNTNPNKVTTVEAVKKYVPNQLLEFKEKEIDYTTIYSYDTEDLKNRISHVEGVMRPLYTVNVDKNNEGYGFEIVVNFYLLMAYTKDNENISYYVDTPLKVIFDANALKFKDGIKNLYDIGLIADGKVQSINEFLASLINETGTFKYSKLRFVTFHYDNTNGNDIGIRAGISIVSENETAIDQLLTEIQGLLTLYGDTFLLYYKNAPETKIIQAQYIGGN